MAYSKTKISYLPRPTKTKEILPCGPLFSLKKLNEQRIPNDTKKVPQLNLDTSLHTSFRTHKTRSGKSLFKAIVTTYESKHRLRMGCDLKLGSKFKI